MKEEFLATVSHEVRTPLNTVVGWSRLMRNGQLDKDGTAHAIEVIERNASAQRQIIEDLLDVSRIITGKLRISTQRVDLLLIVHAAVDAVRGIPPEFLPRVFERFTQADGSSTRKHGGLGLGLGILRHLVELHGGVVSASNRENGGAVLTVLLPAVEPTSSELIARSIPMGD